VSLIGAEPTREHFLDSIQTAHEALRRRFRSSFFDFAKYCLGYDLLPHVHGELCKSLQLAYWGQGEHAISGGIDRHLKLMPRGSFKTSVITQAWPLWILTQDEPPDPLDPHYKPAWSPPRSFNGKKGYDQRILLGQEIDQNVEKFLAAIKELIANCPMFIELFGQIGPTNDNRNRLKWTNQAINISWRQDYRTKDYNIGTCSLKSAANSTHADILIMDDIFGEQQARSTEGNQSTIDFYRRLIPIAENPSLMIFVGTRWDDKDLYGYFIESEEERGKWCIQKESAIRSDAEVAAGKARYFFPERLGPEILEDKRTTMRPSLFSCQYLNEPIDEETAMFKPSYFKDAYFELPVGPQLDEWLRSLVILTTADPAISEEREACDAVILTCGWDKNGHCWTLDMFAERGPSPGAFIDELFRHNRVWRPLQIGVEKDKLQKAIMFYANQQSQLLQEWPPFKDLETRMRSKDMRIGGLEPVARAGRLHFRRGHESLENEMVRYPRAKTKDRLDALAYQLDMAYAPSEREVEEKKEMNGMNRIIFPSDIEAAWKEHQARLNIGPSDPYHRGCQGLNWKQL